MEKANYKLPAVCWLRITDYMHGWMQHELGGAARIKEQRVICIQHLPGARKVLRMETVEESMGEGPVGNSMSATWRNCLEAGLRLDAAAVERMYGVNEENMKLFIPIECPKLCLTKNGVLRPWTLDVNFGQRQATALQRLLREVFWQAVSDYADEYSRLHPNERYAQIDMIEAFCEETETPDLYAEAMRREWQRRQKRASDASSHP